MTPRRFTDQALGGMSFGAILNRDGLLVTVVDAAPDTGLQIDAMEIRAGPGPARITACNLEPPATMILTDSDSILVTCGSLTTRVLAGAIEIVLGAIVVTALSGSTVIVKEAVADDELEITNAQGSTAPIVVEFQGETTELGPGDPPVTLDAAAPTIEGIIGPENPVEVDTVMSAFSATFIDPNPDDTHTAVWGWGDDDICNTGTDIDCTLTKSAGSGSVTGSHTYTAAGVYTVTLTVTAEADNSEADNSHEAVFQFAVVFDPDGGGFVTGGGWIDSPQGAGYFAECTTDTTGKANFGFVSKYKKGANVPTGNTEFNFKAGTSTSIPLPMTGWWSARMARMPSTRGQEPSTAPWLPMARTSSL